MTRIDRYREAYIQTAHQRYIIAAMNRQTDRRAQVSLHFDEFQHVKNVFQFAEVQLPLGCGLGIWLGLGLGIGIGLWIGIGLGLKCGELKRNPRHSGVARICYEVGQETKRK